MIECIKFNEYKSGMLQGFANFYIDKWGVELNGCSVFEKEGRKWIKLPAKEYIDAQGEKKFAEIIWFRDKDLKKAFDEKLAQAFNKFELENQSSNKFESVNSEMGSSLSMQVPF